LEKGIYEIGLKTTSLVGNGNIIMDDITLSGSTTHYVWYDDNNRSTALPANISMTNPDGLSFFELK